ETVALTPPGGASRPPSTGRIPGLDFSDLPPLPDVYVPGKKAPEVDATVALGGGGAAHQDPAEEGRTIAYLQPRVGADPVVGWLVVVDGPDRGRDFRLHAGRNFIGRAAEMNVALTNDPYVSRERHAVVVYDPRGNRFRVAPGEATGLVYRNGETVDTPQDLTSGDEIEVGQSKLRFVPLCTDTFRWDTESPR
ncbi:MAG TPA: FHA domain-containing protein, partial [Rhodothermales bacterium]|nr:FHA domain-containing protein [Rhodothermales bacterium]